MKILKFSFLTIIFGMLAWSCADEPLPFETYDSYKKGGFPRLLNSDGGNFFFTDPSNSTFSFDVEYYSENNGANVAAHEWFVRHRDNANGGTLSEPALLERVEKSAFGTDPKSGLPTHSFSFTLSQALDALGMSLSDVNGGDDLIFDGVIVMEDGGRYGPDNTGGSVKGGAGFDGIFRWIKPLLCESTLGGVYDAFTTVRSVGAGIGWDDCAGNTWEGQVEFVTSGDGEWTTFSIDENGVRWNDPSMGAFFVCYGTTDQANLSNAQLEIKDGDVEIVDACNQLAVKGASQWGEVYSFDLVQVDGNKLTLEWRNDYGEAGTTVLTRTDGTDWPDLKG